MSNRNVLYLFTFLLVTGCTATTPPANDPIVITLADELEENFLFPEAAKDYATYLRTDIHQVSSRLQNPEAYAVTLTRQLQSIHPDGHLRVHYEPEDEQESSQVSAPPTPSISAIDLATTLTPNIAYLRMNLFPGDDATVAAVEGFATEHAGKDNLIIDLRGHRGGGLAEMDVLFSNIFSEKTTLLYMDVRESVFRSGQSPIKPSKTTVRIDGSDGIVRHENIAIPNAKPAFANANIYVLTSNYTVSAAEHLAFALKRTGRASIIGEKTYGGAHFGGDIELGDDFYAFVPVGRTFDPDTGLSWEDEGVIPDIKTTSAKALIKALLLIGMTTETANEIDNNLDFTTPVRKKLNDL